ncbi:MAG: hypothetical protein MUE30_06795 [Spirosomaceae bacterium]|nr:hypothetical protein [Spirosomataceae bacterium]
MKTSLYWVVLLGGLVACSRKNTPKNNEYLLGNQSFAGNKFVKTEALETLLPQRPNKNFMGIPGATVALWVYQAFDKTYDRTKPKARLDSLRLEYEQNIAQHSNNPKKLAKTRQKYTRLANKYLKKVEGGNGIMRTVGEPPVYFEEKIMRANTAKIRDYLVREGYRDAQVKVVMDTVFGRIRTQYQINEGLPHRWRAIDLLTRTDATIDSLLSRYQKDSYLKSGQNYRYDDIKNESKRIEILLQNNGYFGFNQNYLKPVQNALGRVYGGFLIDTSAHDPVLDTLYHIMDIKGLQINTPRNQAAHRQYRFGAVSLRVENLPNEPTTDERDTLRYRGLKYFFTPQHYYAPKVLDSKILIRPGQLFKISDFRETERQLAVLDQFRIINIETDTTGGEVKALIKVMPQDKYQVTSEGGVNVVQNLPGPFVNGTFRVRNVFNRLENFEFSLRGAYDWQFGIFNNQSLVRTLELGANTALIFPRILFPGKFAAQLNRLTPRTIVSLGYNYSNRDVFSPDPEFKRGGFQASLRYTWKRSNYEYLSFTAADFSVLRSQKSANFSAALDTLFVQSGNPLKFSFESAVISGMSFSYTFNNNVIGQNSKAHYWRFFVESGGTAFNLLRQQKLPSFLENFELYKFLKGNVEHRAYWPIGPKSTLVYRLNTGLIYNYNNRRVAPYEKSLTGGGSNSLRAWLPRRLGLGSAYPNLDGSTGSPVFRGEPRILTAGVNQYGPYEYRFEQLGDVLMEANLELRGHLFRFVADVNYAFFIDAGNVWRLRLDKAQVTDQNTLNGVFDVRRFYKEIAVGTGFGLRFDLSYFVFRFDIGAKVYDPSRRFEVKNALGQTTLIDERYALSRFSFRRGSANYPVFNIGVGYPF